MMVSNRNLLFQGSIFRFHVCFQGCRFYRCQVLMAGFLLSKWSKHVSHLKTEGIGNHASSNTLRRRSQTKRRWQKTGANFWVVDVDVFLFGTNHWDWRIQEGRENCLLLLKSWIFLEVKNSQTIIGIDWGCHFEFCSQQILRPLRNL